MPAIEELKTYLRSSIRARLDRNELALGFQVRQWRSVEIARIAKSSGFDILNIDMEHSPIPLETATQMCITALEVGITPIVRIPTQDPYFLTQLLDGGAMGIIAPHMESAKQARDWVRAVKYPPLGTRSLSGSIPQLRGEAWPEDQARAIINQETTVVALVETREGIDNIEEIAAVEGIDVVQLGALDMSAALGIPTQFDHPDMFACFKRLHAAAKANGKPSGIGGLGFRPDLVATYVDLGARYVSVGTDQHFVLSAARERAAALRALKLD